MIAEGYFPYSAFSYLHPPALPLFIAMIYGVSHSVYVLRFVFLLLNTLSMVLFAGVIRSATKSKLAPVLTIAFLMTYNEMLFHDWRMIASRQFANVFFILFLYCGTVLARKKWSLPLQCASAVVACLTLFPVVPNIVFASAAFVLSAPKKERKDAFYRYVLVLSIAAFAVFSLFLIPNAIERLLLTHLEQAAPGSIAVRFHKMFNVGSPDSYFYALATAGLVMGALFHRATRYFCIAMLGMLAMLFVPREYYAHYVVTAVVALGWGIGEIGWLLQKAVPPARRSHVAVLAVLLLSMHASQSIPRLWDEWMRNRGGAFWTSVDFVKTLPEPVLMFMEPMYAIEADKRIVQHYLRAGRQSFTGITLPQYDELASRACSIALTGWDRGVVPVAIQEGWAKKYRVIANTAGFGAYLTNNPGCAGIQNPL